MASQYHFSDDHSVGSGEGSYQETKLEFSEDEVILISKMYNLVGERWSLIAGRIPGRTAQEIENFFWNLSNSKGNSSANAKYENAVPGLLEMNKSTTKFTGDEQEYLENANKMLKI
ncbi:hypothetical protein ACFE04_030033 [Oxalis oulophora]